MSTDMHQDTSAGIRAELAAIGTKESGLQRRQRRARATAAVIGVAAVAVTTSAAALVVAGLPGSTTTAALGTPTTVTRTGPALIDIGRAPATAGAVIVDITCLNDIGMVTVPTTGGSSSGLRCRDSGQQHILDGRLPARNTTTFSVEASPGTEWSATLRYASAVTSPWKVNASGQTYGVENASGHPDLVPATADNGRRGWALWSEYIGAENTATIRVYESDGTTVIGHTKVLVGIEEVPLDQDVINDLNSVRTPTPTPDR